MPCPARTALRVLLVALALHAPASAHGGQYRGPADSAPTSPAPSPAGGPGSVAPGARSSAGPTTPTSGPGSRLPGPSAPPTAAALPGDPTRWTHWWEFNKDPYLDLRATVRAATALPGWNADRFLGPAAGHREPAVAPTDADIDELIVPALLEALDGETNNDVVTGCLVALAKIGQRPGAEPGPSLAGLFVGRLADPVQEIRETAAVALGILADEPSIGTLADLLQDTPRGRRLVSSSQVSYRTRAFAAYGLGLIGYRSSDAEARRRIVHLFARTLEEDETPTADLAASCVISLGLVPIQRFLPESSSPDTALDPAGSRRGQLEYLLALLGEESVQYVARAHAPTALVRLLGGLPPEVVAYYEARIAGRLIELAGTHGVEDALRQSAIQALGALGDADEDRIDVAIRECLRKAALEEPDQQTRHFALIALGSIGSRAAPDPVSDAHLREIGTFLEEQVAGASPTTRPWAALALGILLRGVGEAAQGEDARAAHASGVAVLRRALRAEKSPSRLAAFAIALGMLGDVESRAPLRARLGETSDDETRGYLGVALGLVGDQEAVSPIREVAQRSRYRPDLLRQCAISLGLLGDRDLVPELVEMLGEARGLYAQASIASALGAIGDRRSIAPLVSMLRDPDKTDSARSFAAVALGIVADKEDLPWNSKIAFGLNYRAATTTLDDSAGAGILNIL